MKDSDALEFPYTQQDCSLYSREFRGQEIWEKMPEITEIYAAELARMKECDESKNDYFL